MGNKYKKAIANFNTIKEYINSSVISRGLSSFVEFEKTDNKSESSLTATFACGGFRARIKCTYAFLFIFDCEFIYVNSNESFSIDDVFNVLDIQDFSVRAFSNAEVEDVSSQEKCINNILDIIEKFKSDIAKAGAEPYLKEMEATMLADKALLDAKKIKLKDDYRCGQLRIKMQKDKSEESKQAYLKAMNQRLENNALTTYDKRFVKYLEQGYPIPDNCEDDDKGGDYISYLKTAIISLLICAVFAFIICFGIVIIDKNIISEKGIYIFDTAKYISAAVGGLFLTYILHRIFGTKIIVALSKDQKEYAKKQRKERFNDKKGFPKIFGKYLSVIIAVCGFALLLNISCSGICFCENYFINHNSVFSNTQMKYEDADIYLVKGWYDDNGNYKKYSSPCYRFQYGNSTNYGEVETSHDTSIDTGEISDENQQTEILRIFEKHNIEPVEIKE